MPRQGLNSIYFQVARKLSAVSRCVTQRHVVGIQALTIVLVKEMSTSDGNCKTDVYGATGGARYGVLTLVWSVMDGMASLHDRKVI